MSIRPHRLPIQPGQESVWDYPRPPRLEAVDKSIEVHLGGVTIAETRRALRVLETSHPPNYYLPPGDVCPGVLQPASGRSFCEWKGEARYFDVAIDGRLVSRAAWSYDLPSAPFTALAGYVAFYAALMDRCLVDGEVVVPQPGGFYGGWITDDIVGPFKGEPGTNFW